MSEEQTDNFDWGELGAEWWRATGAQCRATEMQIKFACARHAGASATGAARLAGYTDSPEDKSAIRQSGYKALRTTAVGNMLALAGAEDRTVAPKVLDKSARALQLSEMVSKTPDPTLKIRAIEALNKMDEREADLGQAFSEDGFSQWRTVRDFLKMPGGAVAIFSLHIGQGDTLANLPLLHDVHNAMMRDAPEMWERRAKQYPLHEQVWLKSRLDDREYQLGARVQVVARGRRRDRGASRCGRNDSNRRDDRPEGVI